MALWLLLCMLCTAPLMCPFWHFTEQGWMIFHCSNYFSFCSLNFIVVFPYFIKYYHIMFSIIVFWLGWDRQTGFDFFMPTLLLSWLEPLFLPSSVTLSYFILDVPGHKCFGKHSCMSSPFPIAILNGTIFLHEKEMIAMLEACQFFF